MRQNSNSFEAENAQHNLFLLVKLVLQKLLEIIFHAWEEQTYKLNNALWNTLRHCGVMDSLINNCASEYEIEQFSNARFLSKCLTDTSDYVLKNVEEKVLRTVCKYKTQVSSVNGFKFNFSKVYYNLNSHKYSYIFLTEVQYSMINTIIAIFIFQESLKIYSNTAKLLSLI